MKATILQTDVLWARPNNNQAVVATMINDAQRSDIIVLPEMWSTGFIMEPDTESGCIEDDQHSIERMRLLAVSAECAVSGSMGVRDESGTYRNRLYFMRPDGSYNYYDKRHLFAYGGEDKYYEPGTRRVIVSYEGWRILLATCYDLRFPVWLRNDDDYDMMLISANWPESRCGVWDVLLRARAIENQCCVIAANRTGCDLHCCYSGGSMVIDAKGNILAKAEGATQQVVTADIDIESLKQFRRKFPVLRDRDCFKLTIY